MKDLSSIIISIFKRKGGEGKYTKIINEQNEEEYFDLLKIKDKDEKILICYKENKDFVLITNKRLITNNYMVDYFNIEAVIIAMQEEFKSNILNKKKFTRLKLQDFDGKNYILKLEEGKPYNGIYQILEFISLRNRENKN
ncbi:PH domain-containing protein [Apibacter adventoris]|uniref:YokE-like PH domain-containing protein n=1 Tax=Apibacter adventoris TaxID=1679466 RepID=A0A2S8AE69_9FLAO|nr:hypothetical protein [Apibacter adventoris]PQL93345.1 hypothetical protein C4S77_05050 [Apibacter adventoris]